MIIYVTIYDSNYSYSCLQLHIFIEYIKNINLITNFNTS